MAEFNPGNDLVQGGDYAQAQTDAYRKAQTTNYLVGQYGPQAADPALLSQGVAATTAQQMQGSDVAAAQAENADKTAAIGREAQLRAAYALKQAMGSGIEAGTAFDTIVAPNAQTLGLSASDTAAFRAHLMQNPGMVDSLIDGLAGPAKPSGAPENLRGADGQLSNQQLVLDERGGSHVVTAPEGTTFSGPLGMAGSPKPEQLPDGSWGYRVFTKSGQSSLIHADGTPVAGLNASANQQKADAATSQAKTAAYSAGVKSNNTEYGAPGGAAAPTGPGPGPFGLSPPMASLATGITGAFPGTRVTSGYRSVAANGAAGGVSDSEHMSGNAADFHIPAGMSGPQFAAQIKQKFPGATVLYEGPGAANSTAPHVHVQLPLGTAAAAAPGPPSATPTLAGGPLFNQLPPKGRLAAVGQAEGIVNGFSQLQRADQQIASITAEAGNPLATGLLGQITGKFGGSPGYDLRGQVGQLKALGLQQYIASLKTGGPGGAGGLRIKSEADAAMQAYGNLDPNLSEPVLRQHLQLFQQAVHQLMATAQAGFQQQWGVDPWTAAGVPKPGSAAPGQAAAPASTAALRAKYGL